MILQGLIVVHDDADLPIGQIKVSKNSGSGGHKGVESIIKALKTKNFSRVRIGCQPANYVPGSKLLDRFILKRFTRSEEKIVGQAVKNAVDAVKSLVLGET